MPLLGSKVGKEDVDASLRAFASFYPSMPYPAGPDAERHYERDAQLVLVTLAGAAGFGVTPERHVMGGRADVVVESPGCVLVMELKMDDNGGLSAAKAQLHDRNYAKAYLSQTKPVFEVAVELSRDAHGVSAVDVQQVDKTAC